MKFAVVVVLLALALGIEASGLAAWGAPALSYTAVSGPAWGHGAWGVPAAAWAAPGAWNGAPAAVDVTHGAWGRGAWVGAPAAVAVAAPAVVAAHAPAAITTHAAVVAAAPAWGHEGSYVAKTRGAVHVAPLAGHANSAASINLQPAPGTVH